MTQRRRRPHETRLAPPPETVLIIPQTTGYRQCCQVSEFVHFYFEFDPDHDFLLAMIHIFFFHLCYATTQKSASSQRAQAMQEVTTAG